MLSHSAIAQGTYRAGVLPSVNFNYKLANQWSVNFKVESRQLFKTGTFEAEYNTNYRYVLTDYSLLAAKKIGLNSRLSGGYLLRYRDNEIIHRFIQQYTTVQRLTGYRLAHRLAMDQTFQSNEPIEFRLRYRLTGEFPLNGESADPREFYVKVNSEYLNALEDATYDLEVRLVPLLGYTFTPRHKLEIGLDYRINNFVTGSGSHSFWTSINWYIEL